MEPGKKQPPTPELIWNTIQGHQRTAALKGAIELDVFTAIGEGATTAKALAERCRASERGIRILCDFLVVIGLLTKSGHHYGHTPDSAAFLDRQSPACMAAITKFMLLPDLIDAFKDVAAIVRKGGTVMSGQGTVEPDNPIWIDFARSMVSMMAPAAEEIAALLEAGRGQKWKVLDIAAGHGMFGITIAKHNPNAEVVALDWPAVLTVAQENAQAAGISGRHRTMPGNALEVDYGHGYDIVLITNFLHHFDAKTCEGILRKVHGSLNHGGRAVTLEMVPNEDRVSPPMPASFSFQMLGGTPSGDAYTFSELEHMFREAGFSRTEIHPLQRSPESVLISHR